MNIDNRSMEYVLEQCFSSSEQHKWATKMLHYYYDIICKKGKENVVENSLSHKYEEEGSLFFLFLRVLDWIFKVYWEWLGNSKDFHFVQHLQEAKIPYNIYLKSWHLKV